MVRSERTTTSAYLPRTVLYDPALTTSLPAFVTGPSGLNAMAHCIEALYAKDANPITSLMAEEGIAALATGSSPSVNEPTDLDARSEALYGAYLAGAALGVVGMAVHHRICHVLGGTFGLPHGDVNAVILPLAVRYNQDAASRGDGPGDGCARFAGSGDRHLRFRQGGGRARQPGGARIPPRGSSQRSFGSPSSRRPGTLGQ